MAKRILTVDRARQLLEYSPATGEFIWKAPLSNVVRAGQRAGSVAANGYISVGVDGCKLLGHRLAWLMHYGDDAPPWPQSQIDHINRNKADNRIANLRIVSPSGNKQNRVDGHANNRLGTLGVKRNGKSGFMAQITINGKCYYLGTYRTKDEAQARYLNAKAEHHTEAPTFASSIV